MVCPVLNNQILLSFKLVCFMDCRIYMACPVLNNQILWIIDYEG